jgi:MFS family permease
LLNTYLNALRRFNRDVHLFLIASALTGLTVFGGIYTVLLNLYLLRLGYGPDFVGQVNAAGALSFAVCSLPAGLVGHRWGNRRTLIVGMALAAIGYFLLPLAEFIPAAERKAWLLGTLSFGVLGMSLYLVNSPPFLTARTDPQERSYVFSAMVALWPLAGFAGSLIGGFLPGLFAGLLSLQPDDPAAYRWPLLIAASLLSLATLALIATREKGIAGEQPDATVGGRPPVLLIAIMALVVLLQMAAESSTRTFFNVYMDDELNVPTPLIGGMAAAGQILAVAAAIAAPALAARWGRTRTIVIGSIGMVAALIPLALVPHWLAGGLGCTLLIAMGSTRRSVWILFQQELVAPRWRVTINSVLTATFGVSTAIIAMGGGQLITALGYRPLFLTAAGLTGLGTLLFWAFFRKPRGEYTRRP